MMGHNSNKAALDALAKEITNAEKNHEGDKISHALAQGARLRQGRDLCKSDNDFGVWSRSVNFTDQKTAHNYRTLYDNFGHVSPETIRKIGMSACYKLTDDKVRAEVIEVAESTVKKVTSADIKEITDRIYPPKPKDDPEDDQPDGQPDPKVTERTKSADDEPSAERKAAAIKVLNGEMTLEEAGHSIGVSSQVMKTTKAWVSGHQAAARDNAILDGLSMSATQKLEAAKGRTIKELQAQFDEAVRNEAERLYNSRLGEIEARLSDMKKRADRISKGGQKMLPQDYKLLKMCFHQPQNVSDEKRAKAWEIFKSLDLEPFTPEEIRGLEEAEAMIAKRRAQLDAAFRGTRH